MMTRSISAFLLLVSVLPVGCRTASPATPTVDKPSQGGSVPGGNGHNAADAPTCGGDPLTVTFYDAGQALAALVTLPDSRRVLVDTGESPSRPGCGAPCRAWHDRVVSGVQGDLDGATIDMVWITHQHSDHHGGLPGLVAAGLQIAAYVDNGQEPDKNGVTRARAAARQAGAELFVVEPGRTEVPLESSDELSIRAVVPDQWPASCTSQPNECSIGLLIEYCNSSLLFTGDAEHRAERVWDVGDIDLLQVSHHGSDTSTTAAFVERVKPDYAVISSAPRGEGTNRTYCHPRRSTVERLVQALGGQNDGTLAAFDAKVPCRQATDQNWTPIVTSNLLWITARDGTVRLTTTGNGKFERR